MGVGGRGGVQRGRGGGTGDFVGVGDLGGVQGGVTGDLVGVGGRGGVQGGRGEVTGDLRWSSRRMRRR